MDTFITVVLYIASSTCFIGTGINIKTSDAGTVLANFVIAVVFLVCAANV